ncbi:MAG TPA: twin-arginine translocase TatA/TatE family subunit [Chthoniobacterales bacterium]
MSLLAFGTPGPSEWMLILIIVLVLFGAKKLPELARSLGQSMNEFRKAREEFDRELQSASHDVRASTHPVQPIAAAQPQQQPQPSPVPQVQPVAGAQPVNPVPPAQQTVQGGPSQVA